VLNKVVIFGVGLIGGSFARSLKKAGAVGSIVGMDRSPAFLARALELGIIDVIGRGYPARRLRCAARTWSCWRRRWRRPKRYWPRWRRTWRLEPWSPMRAAPRPMWWRQRVVRWAARSASSCRVIRSPGRETNGPDAAIDNLYVGKKVVLTALDENRAEDVERVAAAWQACGAIIHRLTPQEHDKVFAAVSHLPHLLAYALVDDIANKPHADLLFQYAASGFRDFTRIAGSSPEMWRDISLANQAALLTELDAYLAQLTGLRASLAAGDGVGLERVYANAQRARHQWITAIEAAEAPPKE
jgi:prephenate dehydrogenase